MISEEMKAKLKVLAKHAITVLGMSVGLSIVIHVADLHDFRLVLGVLAGKFGYDYAMQLVNKIKALE